MIRQEHWCIISLVSTGNIKELVIGLYAQIYFELPVFVWHMPFVGCSMVLMRCIYLLSHTVARPVNMYNIEKIAKNL